MNLKKKWNQVKGKAFFAAAAGAMALTVPTAAGAEPPSTYVNKAADAGYGEILKTAPKLVGMVAAFCLLMFLISGDEHKKSQYKSWLTRCVIGLCGLLVLKPLIEWGSGLFG